MNGPRPDKSMLYYPKMPVTWWLRKRSYFFFMMRELSSVFIAIFLVVLLVQIYQLREGPESYAAFVQGLGSPGWLIFHAIALLFAIYHSITWFISTSVVLPLRLGKREIPRNLVTGLNIGAWIGVSLVILGLFLTLKG